MRLPAERIKEAILHTDPDVREAAVFYFARSYSADPTIMPLAIQAFEQYGLDAFEILSFLHSLVQTDETVSWLIREIERVGPGDNEREAGYAEVLVAALRHADPLILERQEPTIQGMQQLDDVSKEELAERIRISSFSVDTLWQELTEFCEAQDQEDEEIADEDYEFICSVVEALGRYSDQFAEQVLAILDTPDEHGEWLEQMAVRLAGEIKLDTAIPHLADRLDDCGTWLYEEARWALAKIGNDAVVKELAERCVGNDLEFCFAAASLLEDIHTDLSVQTCLEMLGQGDDVELRGSLLQSVLMNFSSAGIEPARQHVLTTPKSPDLLEVRSALLVACKMMGETFPEFEAWLEDSKHDVEFRRQWYKDNPLDLDEFEEVFEDEDFEGDDSLEDRGDDDPLEMFEDEEPPATIVRRQPPVGRNDPCPCGSGKKYKKCCYGKAAIFEETDEAHAVSMSSVRPGKSAPKYPIGTVALYGPDDKITTKIVVGVIKQDGAEAIIERFVGSNIKDSPKVQHQIKSFFERHKVKNVVATDGNMGCPHEEGLDFPSGEDCPFCPYWAGKQGSNQRE
jgi:hypothetical protein